MTETRRPDGSATTWLGLSLVRGLEPRDAIAVVERVGGVAALAGAADADLLAAGLSTMAVARVRAALDAAPGEAARVAAAGGRVVAWDDPAYPERLRSLVDPPLVLVVRGTLDLPDAPVVAIVGARRASEYGRRVGEAMARGLAAAGVTVVSGLALGIDGAAHRGALAGGGRTIGVLAHGIEQVYPAWHRGLAREVVERGALVTEFACGVPPLKHHFPRRNRLVSGLASGVVVIEAAERSGSLVTARLAGEQGREVLVVPGPVDHPGFAGSHRLLREGATFVTCADDVLEAIAPQLAGRRLAAAGPTITGDDALVLRAIDASGGQLDAVIGASGLDAPSAMERLLALELRGLVLQHPGMRYARASALRETTH